MGNSTLIMETPPVLSTAQRKLAGEEVSKEVMKRNTTLIECLLKDAGKDTGLDCDKLMRESE